MNYSKQIEIQKMQKLIDSGKLSEEDKKEFKKRITLLKPIKRKRND